ncbi:MAG TPA: hypothetical protein VIH11_04775 [Gemmatimonadaceae bacterium]
MQSIDVRSSGGGVLEVDEASAPGVEFLKGDVMTILWDRGEREIVAAAKKKGKPSRKAPCPKTSVTRRKKKKK